MLPGAIVIRILFIRFGITIVYPPVSRNRVLELSRLVRFESGGGSDKIIFS